MKKVLLFTITLLFGITIVSCSGDIGGVTPVTPTSVTLNQTSLSLKVGDTFKLIATVNPSNADNKTVNWTSLDANVASVSSGLVTAINPGETSIIVTTELGGKTATCKVVVEEPVIPFTGLSFTSSGTTNIALSKVGSPDNINLEYRKGTGDWSEYTVGTYIELKDKESVSFQATETGNANFSKDSDNYYQFSISGEGTIAAFGNIMSLLDRTLSQKSVPYNCFTNLFKSCSKLTSAPELPATTLANSCYSSMFFGCTSLTKAPELPATTLAKSCYGRMFYNCESLNQATELPATVLYDNCYYYMFGYCKSLTKAPELPATTLAKGCYSNMFEGTSLIVAPELPAITLVNGCYNNMFYECKSLIQAPELPATNLQPSCYECMFSNCTSLAKAPKLPATTLASYCYSDMFSSCTSLNEAPELPATNLQPHCYESMFSNCTSLAKAPELLATTLASNCYVFMFNGCTNLNYVKALFTTEPSELYTNQWLEDVASKGTFIKNKNASWNVTGPHGVPSGWDIEFE